MADPRIMLVDDHPLVREGVRFALASAGMTVVAEAGSAEEALAAAAAARPDLVVLDLSLPGGSGLSLIPKLRADRPRLRVLILSVHDNPEHVRQAVQAGADGYLRKDSSPTELRDAVRAVAGGQSYFSPPVASALSALVRQPGDEPDPSPEDRLTPREREVLIRIAEGDTSREIAGRLGLSPRTVESHRESLMKKLSIHTVAGLTRFAIEAGLVGRTVDPEADP